MYLVDEPAIDLGAFANALDAGAGHERILDAEHAMKSDPAIRWLHLETPANPTISCVDIEGLTRIAKARGAGVSVDNTFATPLNQSPLKLGADLVVHSATKFLCGHSDAMGGLLCGKKELVEKVFRFREINGASLQADSA